MMAAGTCVVTAELEVIFFGECKTVKNGRINSAFSLWIYDSNYFMSGDRLVK
jgi:hypothetical protein